MASSNSTQSLGFACGCVLERVVCRVRFARVSCPWLRFERPLTRTLTRCLFTGLVCVPAPPGVFLPVLNNTETKPSRQCFLHARRSPRSRFRRVAVPCPFSCTGSRSNSPGYPVMVSSRRRPSRPRIVSLSRVLRGTCAHQDQSRQDNARAAYRSLSQSMPIQRISLPRSYSELIIIHLHLQRRNSHVQMRFTMSGKAMHPHHSLD